MPEITFDKAASRLEEIIYLLENGKCSLEESVKLFEEGTKLSGICAEKLKKAEQKITELTDCKDGE